ncbi:CLK4-associating serine/arginine rich protein [Aethina tumida]|uniref:CLK4-associating serine/arginine rich protein n=1 Tax=Aethina tumida TaxID=116153 RepID=UPI0021498385|nr:CLK4-associating serine/arginine rich protein [Aethina tumida]
MWHEARRQERKIRGMLVDYRRRAERRRDFYEKIKADPTQFLQVHGRQCKIHLDPAIAAAADSAVMMPWQGQTDNLIDRFDVRAHLDYIPPVKKDDEPAGQTLEDRQLNYERYRIIAQNSFLAISEEKFLKQLHLEEQFGYTEKPPKKDRTGGAAIGFNYEDGTGITQPEGYENQDENSDDNSDSDLDVDLAINVSKMDPTEAHEMNKHGHHFGMSSNDFYSFLTDDLEEAETYRLAKEEEHEKALFSGRKSRRERRAHREKRLANRIISPPSYAAQASPTNPLLNVSRSPSRSPSPENAGKITYITSFGDDEDPPSTSKPTYADKVKYGKPKTERIVYRRRSREGAKRRRSPSRSRSRTRRSSRRRSSSRSVSQENSRYRRSSSRGRNRSFRRRSTSSSSSSSSSKSKSSRSSSSPGPTPAKNSRISPLRAESPPKVLPRYYGRKKSDQSSSDLSELSDSAEKRVNSNSNETRSSGSNITGNSTAKKPTTSMTIQERLKRKRQALLNKQFKADKIAEKIKTEREKQEQQTREDELREMAIKLRKRQREKRHAYESNRSSSSSDSDSDVKSHTSKPEIEHKSRSVSPKIKEREIKEKKRDYYEERDKKERRDRSRDRDDRESSRERRHHSRDRRFYRDRRGSPRRKDDRGFREEDRRRHDRDREKDRDRREYRINRLVDY